MSASNTSNSDIRFFRVIAFVGTLLLVGITVMNVMVETGTIDYPLPRLLIAATLLSCAVASYFVEYIRQLSFYILYAVFFVYNFFGIYLVAVNNFQPIDTSATIIIGFALGTCFKSKRLLNTYLVFLLCTYIYFYITCPDPVVTADYFFLVLFFILSLAFTMFNSKLSTLNSLTESQQKLTESEERFRSIFEKSPLGIALLNRNFQPFQCNEQLLQMSGYGAEELSQLAPKDYIYQEDYPELLQLLEKLFQNYHKSYATEFRFKVKSQQLIWVQLTLSLIEQDNGNDYIVAMMEDVTFRKKANFKLKEYAGELEQHNKALEDFSYVISHDLQEPLRMIRSYTSLIKRRYIDKLNSREAAIDMDYVIGGAEHMSNLIQDMLDYSQWSMKPFKLETIDTREILCDVVKNLSICIADKDAEIYCYEMPQVATNRMLFGQIMQNLIGNGIKYSHETRRPRIEISGEQRDFDVLFRVKDNGMGFEEKDESRIFGIFQRLHGRNSQYSGNGIGLAICKRIVEKQGGRIWAKGEKGAGATFYFTLPISAN